MNENNHPMKLSFARIVTWALFPGMLALGLNVASARSQDYTPTSYIEAFKDAAIAHMEEHGCPASVILAVAMHESANGNSRVARHLNNHFGIKGPNNSTAIRSAYKGYDSVEASYADFIAFLKRRKATRDLFGAYAPHEYERWVLGIARSGYATSSSWSAKVLATIRRYDLHQYDDAPADAGAEVFLADAGDEPATVYVVKKGDTLSAIAKKHQTTVKAIQRKNNMHSTRLQIGQELVL